MTDQMQYITLASRPTGAPTPGNFAFETAPIPDPAVGEVLVRVHYMSLDPYMRGRMDAGKSYTAATQLGETMGGGGVGEVSASNAEGWSGGEVALGMFGWASHAVQPAKALRKLDPNVAPLTATLGVLGMPGFTGWHGLMEYGRPKAGETLVVAAATGPVGSMVGQLAKSLGLRAVGIAGGADKCALALDTFGFDACLDHRAYPDAKSLRAALSDACPNGIDIYFENVGGNHLSEQGFIISDFFHRLPEFIQDVAPKVLNGQIKYIEDIAEGLENAPDAFIGLLEGKNLGKLIVKLV